MSDLPILYERAGVDGLCPSPICWRVRIALALKGVAADRRAFSFSEVDTLANLTGSRTVPVLVVDDTPIVESHAIAAHLDAMVPEGPRLFGDTGATAGGDLERELSTRIGPLVGADFLRRLLPEDRAYYQQSREAKYGKTFEELEGLRGGLELDIAFSIGRLEPRLEDQRYLAGDAVGWVDIVAYTYLSWIAFASPRSVPELVNPVRTWFERLDADWRPICLEPSVADSAR